MYAIRSYYDIAALREMHLATDIGGGDDFRMVDAEPPDLIGAQAAGQRSLQHRVSAGRCPMTRALVGLPYKLERLIRQRRIELPFAMPVRNNFV